MNTESMQEATDTRRQAIPGVPDYRVRAFHGRRHDYCVCVFVLNEGERIRRQLARMGDLELGCDIIVADGGSTDGALADDVLADAGVRTLLVKEGEGRLSAQMRMAFDYAMQAGYAGVVTIDGNDKDDPSAVPSFVETLRAGVDHVQGSRFIPGGRGINTPLQRLLAVRLLHAPLISLAARFRYTDTTNGFRAYSRRLLEHPRVQPFRDVFAGYELHYYLAIRSCRLGLSATELPVTRAYPAKGPTPTKISPLKGNWKVFATLVRSCLHRFDPKDAPSDGAHADTSRSDT